MLNRRDQPSNPSAPTVCRLRVRYAKRGRLRFTSHRDVARAFERALRRAEVPMAYSQGFSPHPKISWVGAAPTGAASEAEYVEIGLVREVDPATLRAELDRALPDGLDLLEMVPAGSGALAERIDASQWRVELPGVPVTQLRTGVDRLLESEQVEVRRLTKNGERTVDVRAALVSVEVSAQMEAAEPNLATGVSNVIGGYGILTMVVRQVTPTVRPDDVLSALRIVADLAPPVPAKAIRMAQGRLDGAGRLVDPLAADRSTASTSVVGKQGRGQLAVE